jgi:hypothetical protein
MKPKDSGLWLRLQATLDVFPKAFKPFQALYKLVPILGD